MSSAVIFDCDGVLFDSWHANVAYYDAIRQRLGLSPMDPEWRDRCHYLAASSVLEAMFGHDDALLATARETARTIDYAPFFELMTPVPGLYDVLATLKARHRLGMATNRSTTVPGVVARFGLAPWIEVAVGVLNGVRPKPHPDVIEAALARLGVAPADAVYVGDAASDLAAATAAGVRFVGVGGDGWAPVGIHDLRELPACLVGMGLRGS